MMTISEIVSNKNAMHHFRDRSFYGDFVNGLFLLPTVVFLAYQVMYTMRNGDPKRVDAICIICLSGIGCLLSILSWIQNSILFSRLLFLCNIVVGSYTDLAEWPLEGECTIAPRFAGGVFALVVANAGSLSFREKVLRLLTIFLVGSYVSIRSPYSIYVQDALPILGGSCLVTLVVFYVGTYGVQIRRRDFMVNASRLVILALFFNHTIRVLASTKSETIHIRQEISGLMKASVLVCMSCVASGTIQQELDQKDCLEKLVKERTKEIEHQADKLRMVNMALQASETAIAITDSSRCIIWWNKAFEALNMRKQVSPQQKTVKKSHQTLMGQELTDSLPLGSKQNETKLRGVFDLSTRREDEILVEGSIFNIEVSPFPSSDERNGASSSLSVAEKGIANSSTSCASIGENNNNNNTCDRFLVVFKDMTEHRARKSAENRALEKATLVKAMQDSMVTLTHELRTPLQGIMGVTSLMLQQKEFDLDDPSQESRDSLGLIMASSSLLLNLINNLLDVKKATANMMEKFSLKPIPAAGPIKDAIVFCQPLAAISNVKVEPNFQKAKHAVVQSNTLRLQQVLINLVSNSIKYTDRGSKIVISVNESTVDDAEDRMARALASSRNDNWSKMKINENRYPSSSSSLKAPVLIFSVSDCGPGIDLSQADRLFHRFARLDSKPSRTLGVDKVGQPSGTGLGLNLCQMFVKRMKGHIWATNNKERGATFSFYLPLVSNESCLDGRLQPTIQKLNKLSSPPIEKNQPNDPEREYSPFHYRVLVVDDVLINRKVFDRMLKRIGLAKVSTADSGPEALRALSASRYDLVITDLQMPGMSGIELSESITKSGTVIGRPVVVGLTADTSSGIAEKCAASGMLDVLYKPITLAEMKDYFETTIPKLIKTALFAKAA